MPELDVAEEFQKLHRGVRRLSLASDRSGELPASACELVAGAQDALLRAAGWQPIAVMGVKPEGVGIPVLPNLWASPPATVLLRHASIESCNKGIGARTGPC